MTTNDITTMLIKLNRFTAFKRQPILFLRRLSGLNLWNEELTVDIKHKIEKHWAEKVNDPLENGNPDKYYVLSMFPYPSGNLHMGHVRVYTISDSVARFQRMNGKNVIHPIGWDAFGLPAENAAIERNVLPDDWTRQNITYMKRQLEQLGCSFDWDREISTCDAEYYKWTQELFLKLFHAGLVYQKRAVVNWDPIDKTVLADEQVDEHGNAWRSGAKVEKKYLKQWFIRTTKFAKQLYEGLDDPMLEDWRDIVKLQKHWIGECDGVRFDFKVNNGASSEFIGASSEFISAWTDKPEYLHQVKFILLNRDNELVNRDEIIDDGVKRLDFTAENPVTGEDVPIFLTNENFTNELDHYLGIPGLIDKDGDFARNHGINFDRIETSEVKIRENCDKAARLNRGGYFVSSKLKDWLISRQRYWGTPIPMVFCESCGTQPVSDLPVLLPAINNLSSWKTSAEYLNWVNTKCPRCAGPAMRETDTLDTFFDSSWYYLRYLDSKNEEKMFDESKVGKLMPVDLYIGGKEHATLHLYYARFVGYFLHSIGLIPKREPFKRLLVQGMVMGRSFKSKANGKYIPAHEIEIVDSKRNKAIHKATKAPVVMSWEKMSKSKYNGVDPTDMFKEYGVDTTRLLIMADVAPTSHRNWNSNTFPGILNWQRRLWMTIQDFIRHRKDPPKTMNEKFKAEDDYMFDSRNYYIKGATFNYCQSQQMSVAVSKMQGLTNSLRKVSPVAIAKSQQYERALAAQIILLAPMAPHFASELWSGFLSAENRINDASEIKWDESVLRQNWPEVDMNYELDLICQINGHENAAVKFPRRDIELLKKEEALRIALGQEKVQQVLRTRTILDVRYNVYSGYENVLNIVTTQPPPKKQEVK